MITPAELHAELTTDPLALGYAAYLAAGNDNQCASLINALTGPGASTIELTAVTKGAVLLGTIPALDHLASGVDLTGAAILPATQQKWQNRFSALRAGNEQLDCSPQFLGMLGQLITDGLITQPYLDAFTQRIGSRAEVLWGEGTVIQQLDISRAMGRG